MSIATATMATGKPLPFEGVTYELKPLTFDDLATMSAWLEARARIGAERAAADDGKNADWRTAFLKLVAGGEFDPGSETFNNGFRRDFGLRKVLSLMLRVPKAEGRENQTPDEVSWSIFKHEPTFMDALEKVAEINADPLATAARRTPLGSSSR